MTVRYTSDGPLATITFDAPGRKNAVDDAGWRQLADAVRTASADDEIRVVVLTGAGGDFCAGADVTALSPRDHPLKHMRMIGEIAVALHELPKPTIAKVDGVAVGAGWNIALACDLLVATPRARFSQIFAKRALSLDFGGSWLLPKLVGMHQAKRLALTAELIDAEEAYRLGLVTWLKPAAELDAFVAEKAAEIAALPPVAVAQSKALLHQAADSTFHQAVENEARAQTVNFAGEDVAAAVKSFLTKDTPRFTGGWAPSS